MTQQVQVNYSNGPELSVVLRADSPQLPRLREHFESGRRITWKIRYGPVEVDGATLLAIAPCSVVADHRLAYALLWECPVPNPNFVINRPEAFRVITGLNL